MSVRRLSGNATASVLSVVLSAIVLFEIYRLLMAELGAEQVGLWSLLMASVALARISEFGVGGGVARFVAQDIGAGRPDRAAATVTLTGVATALLVGACCLSLCWFLPDVLVRALPTVEAQSLAVQVLPFALWSIWSTVVGHVFSAALDGLQRTAYRSASITLQGVTQLTVAYLLVPQHGLVGMAIANLTGIVLHLFLSSALVIWFLHRPAKDWIGFSKDRFVEILRIGARVQVSTIAMLLFDPVVKWSLGMSGGLALTAYYEMANRAITQLRMVIVAAYEVVVPYYAHQVGEIGLDVQNLRTTYTLSVRGLLLVSVPYFAMVALALPLLPVAWLGHFDRDFFFISMLCLFGVSFSVLNIPCFMLYAALGQLNWPTATYCTVAVLNAVFSTLGGILFGGMGVVAGAMAALAAGSLVAIIGFHRQFRIPWSSLIPDHSLSLLANSLLAIPAAALGARWAEAGNYGRATIPAIALVPSLLYLLWRHPLRVSLSSRIVSTKRKGGAEQGRVTDST